MPNLISRTISIGSVLLFFAALAPAAMAEGNGKGAASDAKAKAKELSGTSAEGKGRGKATEGDAQAKELSGMSIVGNNETPKSLYIVPWKGSELGTGTDLTANLLNDSMAPVDKEVFMRELDYYEISSRDK